MSKGPQLSPEARLKAIIDATRAGTWEWNLDTGEVLRARNLAAAIVAMLLEASLVAKAAAAIARSRGERSSPSISASGCNCCSEKRSSRRAARWSMCGVLTILLP